MTTSSNERFVLKTANGRVKQHKDEWFCARLFNTNDEESQSRLSLHTDVTLRLGDATFKLLVDKVTESDKKELDMPKHNF